jgi:SM-20-related protein
LNTLLSTRGRGPFDGDVFDRIIEELRNDGYVILNNVFSIEQLQRLFIDIKDTDSQYFHAAGIGREQEHHVNQFVRRDRICWLDRSHVPVLFYLDWAEQLRQRLNRELFLGLFDYECQYAHYPKGAFYKRHLDAFKGFTNRRLTTILYLNPTWQPGDGGELVMYAQESQTVLETVLPEFGTMVLFLSEEFPHEVLPAKRSRYSLSGWFRINNSDSVNVDPPK